MPGGRVIAYREGRVEFAFWNVYMGGNPLLVCDEVRVGKNPLSIQNRW